MTIYSMCFYVLLSVDDRFPPDATVEFMFSNGPEKMKGEYQLSILSLITACVKHSCFISKRLSKVEKTAGTMPPSKWTITPPTLWSDGILMRTSTCTTKTVRKVRHML